MSITIVGLGPGRLEQITLEAWHLLQNATEVYLRTQRHPLVEQLPQGPTYASFDDLYDTASDFESLYQTIAERIIALGKRPEGVIYAVPGHPMIGEQTTRLIIAGADGTPVRIVDGLSFIEPTLAVLQIDGMDGLQLHDALDIIQMYHPPLNPDLPSLIAQVYSRSVASDLKLTLMNLYPDEYPVVLLHGAGTSEAIIERIPLYEIDRSDTIAHLTSLYIPAMQSGSSFEALQEVLAHLRSADGCPWDQAQTHQSLRPHFLEEVYEVLEALDAEDNESLVEELGDVFLHLVFQIQIAIDEGEFAYQDVFQYIVQKMIRRHPHIWGDIEVDSPAQVERNWEVLKQKEHKQKKRESQLDGVPVSLPALVQAYRIQERAAMVGFDWDDIAPVIAKVSEEINEIHHAPDAESRAKEFGDLLFAVVNWARWLKIDPESALRETNARFKRRFAYIEQQANRPMREMTLAEMDKLWDEAKQQGL